MIKSILNSIPFVRKYFEGVITIFMLHRVYPFEQNKLYPNENMKVSPEFLENFIVELKLHGYEFISLDRAYEILQNGENIKKQIVFTLDDGYKDNYEIAYPVFKKYNIPFTIYITTSFPQNEAILWWYILEDLIVLHDEIILSDGEIFNCKTYDEKIKAFMKIRAIIIALEQDELLGQLNELFSNYLIDWQKRCEELAMSWEQIIELSKDKLCTIAGHTKNHLVLNKLNEQEIIKEIVDANQIIESKINKKIEHFAYPLGSSNEIGQREFDIVKSLNFKTTTSTRRGNIYNVHKNHLECLPRIMLTEKFGIKDIGKIRRQRVVTL